MSILTAENSFRNGLMALADSKPRQAAEYFHTAMTVDKNRGRGRSWVRYLSYYGYSLARTQRTPREAVELCERAVRLSRHDPDILLNLGRVYASTGKISRALRAFQIGLEICPDHNALQVEMSRHDRRSSPMVSFLSRNHPINRTLGRWFRNGPQRPRCKRIAT